MTDQDPLTTLARLLKEATPGPWGWFGTARDCYIATRHSGRRFVMRFKRHGMRGAEPEFQVNKRMVPAHELAVFEVCRDAVSKDDPRVYRDDIVGFRSADAQLMIEAVNLAPALLELWKAAREFHAISQGERNMDKWNQLGAALRALEVTK